MSPLSVDNCRCNDKGMEEFNEFNIYQTLDRDLICSQKELKSIEWNAQ